ncbi:putative transcription factor interactor and regulator CCHC(Zn) family [Helianthus anomalus]
MNFVHGTCSEAEKEIQFSRQTNEEFYAQNKQQQQAKDVSKKTCFKCDQVGHVGRKCPQNLKPVDVEQKKQQSVAVKLKSTKFESKQTWKPKPKTPKCELK